MSYLVWNMEEHPLPEKLLVLAVLWDFFVWLCSGVVFFNVYLMQVIVFKVSYVSLLSSPV